MTAPSAFVRKTVLLDFRDKGIAGDAQGAAAPLNAPSTIPGPGRGDGLNQDYQPNQGDHHQGR